MDDTCVNCGRIIDGEICGAPYPNDTCVPGGGLMHRATVAPGWKHWRGDFAESEITRTLDALVDDVEALPSMGYSGLMVYRKTLAALIAKHRPKDGT